jgi:hypothetical protein
MQGRPIDKTFILEYISDGYKENERDENSAWQQTLTETKWRLYYA